MNKIEIEVNGKQVQYDVLLKVELKDENGTYILYTNHEKNDLGDVIVYAGIIETGKDDDFMIKPVKDEAKLELLEDLLEQIDTRTNQKEVEK